MSKLIDLKGQVFNFLEVVSFSHTDGKNAYWICRCQLCGDVKSKPVAASDLKKLKIKTCGKKFCTQQVKIKDISSKKFSKLEAIRFSHTSNGQTYWVCRCECGTEKIYSYSNLVGKHSVKSCGNGLCNGKIENLCGQVFGAIKVIEFSHSNKKGTFWVCKCVKCGEKTRPTSSKYIKTKNKLCENNFCSGKTQNLVGEVFNYLEVVEHAGISKKASRWICKCLLCGNITLPIQQSHLKFGTIKACGCCKNVTETKLKDIIKKIFGENYAVRQSYRPKFLRPQHIDIAVFDKEKKCILAVEYDGKQHFLPVRFGGISEKKAKENLKYIIGLDKRKDKIIKQNQKHIKFFVRFNYKESLTEEYVRNKLVNLGIFGHKRE